MSRIRIITAVIAALVLAGSTPATAIGTEPDTTLATPGRLEDPDGDAVGGAPDIVAVTVSEPEDGPLVAVSVEFASEPPLGTDMATYTDVVFVDLICDPEETLTVGLEGQSETDYIFGTHGVTLERDVAEGSHLFVAHDEGHLIWHVVDVDVEGSTVTWTIDRSLLGDPDVLSWVVLVGVEREEGTTEEGAEEEYDTCPDVGQPRGVYTLRKAWR